MSAKREIQKMVFSKAIDQLDSNVYYDLFNPQK